VGDEHQPATDGDPYASPSLPCDVVMKGGITSGVVYPRAITELARRYCFKSIGGTSAGAIAAAVTAAAEHNRGGGGFRRVEKLPGVLGGSAKGESFMLRLFTPDRETRTFFKALVGFKLHGKFGGFIRLFRWFWRGLMPPVILVVAAILVCVLADAPAVYAVLAGFAAILLAIIGLVTEVLLALRAIGRNDFGVGHLGPEAGEQALTPWLHKEIQETAGRTLEDAPLTFADLWGVLPLPPGATEAQRKARKQRLAELSNDARDRAIDLQMMTTSLSHGRPIRLPATLQKRRLRLDYGGGLLFRPSEMSRYFPARVVEHLKQYGELPQGTIAQLLATDPADEDALRHFPIGPDLPVIVATRMSLSFPILIAAVSLWEFDFAVSSEAPPLKRVVFSDGGLTSNFPIHFFDSPAPTRPTFGLQLTGFEAGDGPIKDDPGHSVEDPPRTGRDGRELRADLVDLRGFLTALKDAMQNWRDNTQSELPGSRERIERIRLGRGEGGLNLTMEQEQIDRLTKYGEIAGQRLVTLFTGSLECAPEPTEQWKDHLFARYRVTMSVLERFLGDFAYGYRHGPEPGPPYKELIEERTKTGYYAFRTKKRARAARVRSRAYTLLANPEAGKSLDDEGVPRPPATLRAVPPA
jgi:predicted acylesterase/phospholipase RssA